MSLFIYKIEQTPVPYDGELGDKEFNFLAGMIDEHDGTYYVYPELLKDILESHPQQDLPTELVSFLQARLTERNDYWFIVG